MFYSKWIRGNQDWTDAKAVRRAVFVEEQGIAADVEFDAIDSYALHAVLYDDERENLPIAAGRVYHDGKHFCMGRICVLKDCRGEHAGDLLTRLLLRKSLDTGAKEIHLHAQLHAVPFYQKFGFSMRGEIFEEAGIPHVEMVATQQSALFPSKCGGHHGEGVAGTN